MVEKIKTLEEAAVVLGFYHSFHQDWWKVANGSLVGIPQGCHLEGGAALALANELSGYNHEVEQTLSELQRAVSETPNVPATVWSPECQKFWESCIRLSDKAYFRYFMRHLEMVEARCIELEGALKRALPYLEAIEVDAICGEIRKVIGG